MKPAMLSSFRSAITTATVMTVVVSVFNGGNTNTFLFADAQLYVGCSDQETDSGVPYELCIFNGSNPVTVDLKSGDSVSFGTESFIAVSCVTGIARSVDSCVCDMFVNPSDPLSVTDLCNSCTVVSISETSFLPYFDCSNRLIGDCVGFDSQGLCIDNNGGTVPAPVPAPVRPPISAPVGTTIPPPAPVPVAAPRPPPTPFPVTAPLPPPTPFPVTVTTAAPLPPPTPFPVTAPTLAPLPPPTPFPVKAPTLAPLPPPTKLPTRFPVTAPTLAPRSPPMSVPVSVVRAPSALSPPPSIEAPVPGTVAGVDRELTSRATNHAMFPVPVLALYCSVGLVVMMMG